MLYQEYVNAKRAAARSKVKKMKLDVDAPIKEEKMEEMKSDDAMEINNEQKENETEKEKEKEDSKSEMDMKETEDDIYGRDSDPMARYEFFVNELLAILKEKLEPSNDLFTRLLLDAPELTPSAIQAVKGYCEDEMR